MDTPTYEWKKPSLKEELDQDEKDERHYDSPLYHHTRSRNIKIPENEAWREAF